jgi:hypothetical protein
LETESNQILICFVDLFNKYVLEISHEKLTNLSYKLSTC